MLTVEKVRSMIAAWKLERTSDERTRAAGGTTSRPIDIDELRVDIDARATRDGIETLAMMQLLEAIKFGERLVDGGANPFLVRELYKAWTRNALELVETDQPGKVYDAVMEFVSERLNEAEERRAAALH